MNGNEKLSIREAAHLLGLSPFTLRGWVARRVIPFYKVGRRVLLDRADVDAILAAGRREVREDLTKSVLRRLGLGRPGR